MALTLNLFLTLVETFAGQHGHVHFQRAIHMSAMVFLCRLTVVGLTGLNQPNGGDRCLPIQDQVWTYKESLKYVFSNFPHKSCGDLIYSGHTALIVIWALNMDWQNGIVRKRWYLRLLVWVQASFGVSVLVICRSHYTVDVALGAYFAYFISEFYYLRALNVYQGDSMFGRFIQRLEYWGADWEKAGKLDWEIDDDDADDDGAAVGEEDRERIVPEEESGGCKGKLVDNDEEEEEKKEEKEKEREEEGRG